MAIPLEQLEMQDALGGLGKVNYRLHATIVRADSNPRMYPIRTKMQTLRMHLYRWVFFFEKAKQLVPTECTDR